jgi:hypothetical protein
MGVAYGYDDSSEARAGSPNSTGCKAWALSVRRRIRAAGRPDAEQEQWLAENRSEIACKIEAGYPSAERGDMLDAEQVRARLNGHKQAWREQNNR